MSRATSRRLDWLDGEMMTAHAEAARVRAESAAWSARYFARKQTDIETEAWWWRTADRIARLAEHFSLQRDYAPDRHVVSDERAS